MSMKEQTRKMQTAEMCFLRHRNITKCYRRTGNNTYQYSNKSRLSKEITRTFRKNA
jgi:hypothetical protein